MGPTRFAWTAPGVLPAYVNLTGNRLTVRSPMRDGISGVDVGHTATIDLPPDVVAGLFGWRNAVIDAAVTNWTYTAADEADPKGAVDRLLVHAINQERHELRERLSAVEAERDAAVAKLARCIDGMDVALEECFAEGARRERAAVVAWLRSIGAPDANGNRQAGLYVDNAHRHADAIERADHITATASPAAGGSE